MRFIKRKHTNLPDLNMTPMIDVVFQLLIFFMTVSQVSAVNREQLQLPKLDGSKDQERTSLTVNISETGELKVSRQSMTIARLVSLVTRELDRLGGDPSRLTIVVRADERGTSKAVNEVVSALARLGIQQIRVAVEVPI
jgi:biopolymer transport protein ExbD